MKRSVSYKDLKIADLKDPEYVKVYLETAIEEYQKDGDKNAFLLALRDIAEAQGGITKLSGKTNINRHGLYKSLSEHGNLSLDTLDTVLHSLGFRISVEPLSSNSTR